MRRLDGNMPVLKSSRPVAIRLQPLLFPRNLDTSVTRPIWHTTLRPRD
jgi:hypothetical protein